MNRRLRPLGFPDLRVRQGPGSDGPIACFDLDDLTDLDIARDKLEGVGATDAITAELCGRVLDVYQQASHLAEFVDLLSHQVEGMGSVIQELIEEHEDLLKTYFPNGEVPDNCQLIFEDLSGLIELDQLFGSVLRRLASLVPDYHDSPRRRPSGIDPSE